VWEAGYFNDRAREFTRTADAYLDDMLAVFRRGDPPPVPAEAGRRALALAAAAVQSFHEGRRVAVPAPTPE
jgi:predicted dehydrogenase